MHKPMTEEEKFQYEWCSMRPILMQHAVKLREDAGYAGKPDDGGARAFAHGIDLFEAGVARYIPQEWRDIAGPVMDPEYATYLRLQAKFGP